MEAVDRHFERMVNEHKDRVFATSLAMTGNRHDAEEVAQDTFFRAYRALETYSPERIRELKERAWLHRIAINVVRNRVRVVRPRLVVLTPQRAGGRACSVVRKPPGMSSPRGP